MNGEWKVTYASKIASGAYLGNAYCEYASCTAEQLKHNVQNSSKYPKHHIPQSSTRPHALTQNKGYGVRSNAAGASVEPLIPTVLPAFEAGSGGSDHTLARQVRTRVHLPTAYALVPVRCRTTTMTVEADWVAHAWRARTSRRHRDNAKDCRCRPSHALVIL